MSWSERHVQDHKRQTDRAIHRASAQLAPDPSSFAMFHGLLLCARKRAPRLLDAPVSNGRHPGIDALVNLSRFSGDHTSPTGDWAGNSSSWRPAISSLAHHLIGHYDVPSFLASAWYATDTNADRKRHWFVAHSRGSSFRSLDLPLLMTRRMEHIFLASPHHLSIEHALRRAELVALQLPSDFIKAIMSTPLALNLRDGHFWRTVWIFLGAKADAIDPDQVVPILDYIQANRQHGIVEFGLPESDFCIKGRTVPSLLRLMREWHRSLGVGAASFSWAGSPFNPMLFDDPAKDAQDAPRRWQMLELTSAAQLRREGLALRHCVASYADRCYRGRSSIWSLRFLQNGKISHVLTVELDPRQRAVVQARGRANRSASGRPLSLLQQWAAREKLQMTL